ncbi:MAG: M23 family metallopeptidase [Deltaproteobacteria bacterium]|nr:M23 family metallopeptidase [Deltaproteobacteria bacterium]
MQRRITLILIFSILACFISVSSVTDLKQISFLPKGRPVLGRITSGFGLRRHPLLHRTHFHSGVDIAARTSTLVRATAPGKIKISGKSRSYGNYVVVDHGHGWETLYAHLRRPGVLRVGEKIGLGGKVGEVGSSGFATGAHLHYEVRYSGQAQDPRHFINESNRLEISQLENSHPDAVSLLQ